MNLILATAAELDARGRVWLCDRRADHIKAMLAPVIGRGYEMGLVGGPVGQGVVTQLDARGLELEFRATGPSRAPLPLHLVVALPRPKVAARILEAATTFGVRSITLINSWRVDKSYFASPLVAPPAVEAALWRGAEQGKITHLPTVTIFNRFMAFIESAPAAGLAMICHPGAPLTMRSACTEAVGQPISATAPAVVVIGPEGGFIDRELQTFADRGFVQVSLSAATLRCEQAVCAALSQFESAR